MGNDNMGARLEEIVKVEKPIFSGEKNTNINRISVVVSTWCQNTLAHHDP
jgi:hypothetical protein